MAPAFITRSSLCAVPLRMAFLSLLPCEDLPNFPAQGALEQGFLKATHTS
jgi:hypothetical protein